MRKKTRPKQAVLEAQRPAADEQKGFSGFKKASLVIGCACVCLGSCPAPARTLDVAPQGQFALPSQAIAAAKDGDTIRIAPGDYFDCASVAANDVTIEGSGAGATITDKTCDGKAILVIRSRNAVVRNLTLRRARVPDGNGAGIRHEQGDLTVDHVTFENDQVGVLSGAMGGRVTVTGSTFTGGGVGGDRPGYAITVGEVRALVVTGSRIDGVFGGGISTAAGRSELRDNRIEVGTRDGQQGATYAILATAGNLVAAGNRIKVGQTSGADAAIAAWDDATARLTDNSLENASGRHLALLRDWTTSEPATRGNAVAPGDEEVTTSGLWRHRASSAYRRGVGDARTLAKATRDGVKAALGR